MSLLRVCAFAKCLKRRSLFENCAVGVSFADCCQLAARNGAVRRISETPLQLQRRNVSFVIPKTENAKKRMVEQFQLLDVLEARIQQLQSDVILDVQHAKVQIVKAPSYVKGGSPGKGPRSTPQEKTDIPKSGQTVAKGAPESQPSRSMEKLTKKKKQQHLQQEKETSVKEKPTPKSKASKSSLMTPATTHQTISATGKKSRTHKKLSDEISAAVSSKATATATPAAAGTEAMPQKVSKKKPKSPKSQAPGKEKQEQADIEAQNLAKELAEVEELEKRLSQQVSHCTLSSNPDSLQDGSEKGPYGDIPLRIRCHLEACIFAGNIQAAQRFLSSRHRNLNQRKSLDVGIYNIMMKARAKMGTLNDIGRIFILLQEAGLKPDLESYSAALECMGRAPRCSPLVISRCLNQMEEDGLCVDDLFSQCVFRRDERDVVLKAIHTVKPDYQHSHNVHTSQCSTSLVQDFYTQRDNHAFPKLDLTQEELQKRFKRQLRVEQACTVTIESVEARLPITEDIAKMRKLLDTERTKWQEVLLRALKESKMILSKTNTKDYKVDLYPYLCLLEDREYVDIMVQSAVNLPPNGESLQYLARDLGNSVYTKYCVRQKNHNQLLEKLGDVYSAYTDLLAKDTKVRSILPRELWSKLEMEHSSGPTLQAGEVTWPQILIMDLGTYLVDLTMKNLKINSDILNPTHERKLIPILYHMYTFRSTRKVGFIKPHPILTQIVQEARETKLTFDSSVMPMLCPPVPWTSVKFGAYLLTPTKLMRTVDGAFQHEQLLEKCDNLHAVWDSLNQLGNCAWRINKPLLDIIISIFNDRGNDKLGIPPPLSEAPKVPHFNHQDSNLTADEKAHLKKEAISAKKKYSEMHSVRVDALYKLSIAYCMRDEIFWFPHSMDFRGRTYPCPPYFNHLGSDVTRAILLFAEGKPLGPKGLDWLKIHLINLTGLKKKCSQQERLDYANSIMEDILDSADNPLNGKTWWMTADEPLQSLACCMEIAKAVRSPDPTQFISHFPVHQDGSCNGLQHYAALGRDVIGATSVNLMPGDMPQDVYSGVAQQVEDFRARDAKNGMKMAQVLEGFISRKVVKQTVMTVVYGVTHYGGRLQIEKRLKEIDEFPKDSVWDASRYLVHLVFDSLKEMFKGTREIQDWLTESARLISKSGHPVEWVTPLGLPIIQSYHRTRNRMMKSNIQMLSLRISHDSKEKPDTVKQKNAFPPNFIHSLDSTHMMLTALHCYSAGLTFVSVHDCFWTHALTVDTMNKICREQFVALHSQPILQDLSDFMLQKYCGGLSDEAKNKKYQEYRKLMLLLARVPQTGDFDLQWVKESTYFFS